MVERSASFFWRVGVGALLLLGAGAAGTWRPAGAEASARRHGAPAAVVEVGAAVSEGTGRRAQLRAVALGSADGPVAALAPGGDVLLAAATPGGGVRVVRQGPDGRVRWERALAGPGARVDALAAGPDGGAWVTGFGAGAAGPTSGAGPASEAGPTLEAGPFIARLTARGDVAWLRGLAGEGPAQLGALVADAEGAFVGGAVGGVRDFGGAPVRAREGWVGVVARLRPDGGVAWVRALGEAGRAGGGTGGAWVRGLAADGQDVVAVGGYRGRLVLGAPHASWVGVAASTPFVVRLRPGGAVAWGRELAGAEGAAGAVAVGAGRVFVTGGFRGQFAFAGGRPQAAAERGFLVALEAEDGADAWARTLGREGQALALDAAAGALRVAGTRDADADGAPAGLFVSAVSPADGAALWARRFGAAGPVRAARLLVPEAPEAPLVLAGAVARADGAGREGFVLTLGR